MSAPSSVPAVPLDAAAVGEALAAMRGHAPLVQCLSNVVAALAPRTGSLLEATRRAKTWLTSTLRAADALRIGHGPGPVHHCHDIWKDENDWKDSDR